MTFARCYLLNYFCAAWQRILYYPLLYVLPDCKTLPDEDYVLLEDSGDLSRKKTEKVEDDL